MKLSALDSDWMGIIGVALLVYLIINERLHKYIQVALPTPDK